MRGFNLSLRYIVMLSLMLGLFSCEHRELTDPQDNHYIRVYLDEQIKNITCGIYNENYENPEYNGPITLRAILADPQSGEVISERILRGQGKDERGRYIDGYIVAPSGTYNILIHSVGSSVSKIKNEDNFYKIYSFTDPVNEYYLNFIPVSSQNVSHSLIAQQPEHLFHDISEQIIIPFSKEVDTLRNSHGDYFMAKSMVLSYYVQIRIYGLEWVNSVASLMSGMAGSSKLNEYDAIIESDSVHLFFTMKYADKMRRDNSEASTAVLYSTFNTYGKLPKESTILTLEFVKSDGSSQVERIDITGMFETELVKEKQWILLDKEIIISKPEGTGGMKPGVEGWKDIEADIPM